MNKLSQLVLLVFLTGCGAKIPDFTLPTASKTETPVETPAVVAPVVVEPTIVNCESDTPYLFVVKSSYKIVFNTDGTSRVSCAVENDDSTQFGNAEEYSSDPISSDQQFSMCRIYYHTRGVAYWLRFNVPGSYQPEKGILNPIEKGWQIYGMPEFPSDGILMSGNSCEEVE